ncbi:MAG TPA: response regulator [Pyrinomonadaceae bacterium]|nr:response regulator [Pyrinomonadaceae bacterium]
MSGPILIIEDDPDIVDVLRYVLQSREYPTRIALNGIEGLMASMDQAELPSLILLDMLLPEMNGIEICRRLRREKSTRGIPIIMVTAKASEADFANAMAVGVDDYITKPFSVRTLLERVDLLLKRVQELAD